MRLEAGKVVALPGFGGKTRKGDDGAPEIVEAKRAGKVLAAIEESKRRPFARVLYALGIRHAGSGVTAQALVEHYPSMDALLGAGAADLAEIPGIGGVVAEAVEQFLGDEHNRETIEKLRAAGVRLVEDAPVRAAGPLTGIDVRAHRQAADPHARPGPGARRGRRGGKVEHPSARTATWSPGRARARSSTRRASSACRSSMRPACWSRRTAPRSSTVPIDCVTADRMCDPAAEPTSDVRLVRRLIRLLASYRLTMG